MEMERSLHGGACSIPEEALQYHRSFAAAVEALRRRQVAREAAAAAAAAGPVGRLSRQLHVVHKDQQAVRAAVATMAAGVATLHAHANQRVDSLQGHQQQQSLLSGDPSGTPPHARSRAGTGASTAAQAELLASTSAGLHAAANPPLMAISAAGGPVFTTAGASSGGSESLSPPPTPTPTPAPLPVELPELSAALAEGLLEGSEDHAKARDAKAKAAASTKRKKTSCCVQ